MPPVWRTPRASAAVAGLVLLLLAAAGVRPTGAAVNSVTTAADAGPGSLREAITRANAGSGHDEVGTDLPLPTYAYLCLPTYLPAVVMGDPVAVAMVLTLRRPARPFPSPSLPLPDCL